MRRARLALLLLIAATLALAAATPDTLPAGGTGSNKGRRLAQADTLPAGGTGSKKGRRLAQADTLPAGGDGSSNGRRLADTSTPGGGDGALRGRRLAASLAAALTSPGRRLAAAGGGGDAFSAVGAVGAAAGGARGAGVTTPPGGSVGGAPRRGGQLWAAAGVGERGLFSTDSLVCFLFAPPFPFTLRNRRPPTPSFIAKYMHASPCTPFFASPASSLVFCFAGVC